MLGWAVGLAQSEVGHWPGGGTWGDLEIETGASEGALPAAFRYPRACHSTKSPVFLFWCGLHSVTPPQTPTEPCSGTVAPWLRALQVAGCGCSATLGSVSSGSAEMTAFALSRFKCSLNAAGPLIAEQSDCPYLRHRGDQGPSRHAVPRRGRSRRIGSTRMCLVTRRIGASLGYRRLLSPKKRKRKDRGQGTLR